MMIHLLCKCKQTLTPIKGKQYFSISTSATSNRVIAEKPHFTIKDIKASCGLSDQFFQSQHKHLVTTPDLVIGFFQICGFSQTQVEFIVSKYPRALFQDPLKMLQPKFDFFNSIGLSRIEIVEVVTKCPYLLGRSYKVPLAHVDVVKTALGGEQNLLTVIKLNPYVIPSFISPKYMSSNLSTLMDFGVQEERILEMMTARIVYNVVTCTEPCWFKKIVPFVLDLGFDPSSWTFQNAVTTMGRFCTEAGWEERLEVFRGLGFSEYEIGFMFKKHPGVISMPKEKIKDAVDFYLHKFHWSPSQLSKNPRVLASSLDKKIIPRCLVLQILAARNKITSTVKLSPVLKKTDSVFLERYVRRYEEEIPEVLDAYRGTLKASACNFGEDKLRKVVEL